MWTLFETLVNFFQASLMLHFLKRRLHLKKHPMWSEFACIAATTILMSLSTWGVLSNPVPDFFYFLIPLSFSLFAAKDKWFICVFWGSVLILIFFLTVALSLHIFTSILGVTYEEMMQQTTWRIHFVIGTNVALSVFLYAISKFKKDYSAPYWPALLLFICTNAALFLVEESVYRLQMAVESSRQGALPSLLGAYFGLAICLMLVILLYHLMSQSVERENRYQVEISVIAQSNQYQEELSRMYTNLCHSTISCYKSLQPPIPMKKQRPISKNAKVSLSRSICTGQVPHRWMP